MELKITIPGSQREASKVFTVSGDHTLESAHTSIGGILVVADVPGADGNIQESIINSIDFFDKTSLDITANPDLTVVNPNSFTNGLDRETDSELIDKIKLVTQGLTGGTSEAIRSALLNLIEPETNRSIYSVGLESFEDVNNIYIDGGLGIDKEFQYQREEVILEAKGGETLLQLRNRPVAYPFIETKEIDVIGKTLGEFIEGKSFNFQVYNPNLVSDTSEKGAIIGNDSYNSAAINDIGRRLMFNIDSLKKEDQENLKKPLTLFNLLEKFNDLYGVEKTGVSRGVDGDLEFTQSGNADSDFNKYIDVTITEDGKRLRFTSKLGYDFFLGVERGGGLANKFITNDLGIQISIIKALNLFKTNVSNEIKTLNRGEHFSLDFSSGKVLLAEKS